MDEVDETPELAPEALSEVVADEVPDVDDEEDEYEDGRGAESVADAELMGGDQGSNAEDEGERASMWR